MNKRLLILPLLTMLFAGTAIGQKVDSTILGTTYPYKMPLLGKKAWERGYRIPLPHGISVGTIFNKQNILLDNLELALQEPDGSFGEFVPVDGLLDFGPSTGRINTFNFRFDTWLLPFLGVGGYVGKVWGEQSITFSILGSDLIESITDVKGNYYGLNLIGIVPLGFANLGADYSWSWTTNERLDKPVRVNVSGIRLIRQIPFQSPGRFIAVWVGTQYQRIQSQTSGSISFQEALGISDEDLTKLDEQWQEFRDGNIPDRNGNYWDDLSIIQRRLYEGAYNFVTGVVESTVGYKFTKDLEANWNLLIGANYQHSPRWTFRSEYGFVSSKQQLMFMIDYRFGL